MRTKLHDEPAQLCDNPRHMIHRHAIRTALCLALLPLAGCVTPPRKASDMTIETDEQRSTREVFRDDWLRPSITQEDYDFFYKGLFGSGR